MVIRLLNVPGCSVQAASKLIASSMQHPGFVSNFLNSRSISTPHSRTASDTKYGRGELPPCVELAVVEARL